MLYRTKEGRQKSTALVMLVVGGLATYAFGDVGIALLTVFNLLIIVYMPKEAVECLNDIKI